jgi:hypothetical protein
MDDGILVCQMACFRTKNPNLGKFWWVVQCKMLVYFMAIGLFYVYLVNVMAIWYILRPLGIFYRHLVYFSRFGKL